MTHQPMVNYHIEQLPPCPACNNQKFKWLFVKDGRHFWRCTNCHLEKQHPLPSLEELEQYYQQSYIGLACGESLGKLCPKQLLRRYRRRWVPSLGTLFS